MANLKIRAIITILGIPALLAMTLFSSLVFSIVFGIAGMIILFEISRALKLQNVRMNLWVGYPIYLVLLYTIMEGSSEWMAAILVLSIIVLMSWELFRNKPRVFENSAATLFASLLVGLAIGFLLDLQRTDMLVQTIWNVPYGAWMVLAIFSGVWTCDISAYLIGSAIGSHKIFPRVSPKKSWEGSIAGMLGAIAIMLVFYFTDLLPRLTLTDAVALGLITGVLGQVGDFAESLVKRDVEIKDSSHLIPGHGGIWDRMDSLLFAIPAGYLYFTYFITA